MLVGQQHGELAHIGQRRRQHVIASQAAQPALGLDHRRLAVQIYHQAVAHRVDAGDEAQQREGVQHRGHGGEVGRVEIRRQLDAERPRIAPADRLQGLGAGGEIITQLRLARKIGAGQVHLRQAGQLERRQFGQDGQGVVQRHAGHGQEQRFGVVVSLGVVQVITVALVGQAHGVDAAQRGASVTRLRIAGARFQRATLGHHRAGGGTAHLLQFLPRAAIDAGSVEQGAGHLHAQPGNG